MEIPMLKIIRLIFNMGILILVRQHFCNETAPRCWHLQISACRGSRSTISTGVSQCNMLDIIHWILYITQFFFLGAACSDLNLFHFSSILCVIYPMSWHLLHPTHWPQITYGQKVDGKILTCGRLFSLDPVQQEYGQLNGQHWFKKWHFAESVQILI